MRDVEHGAEHIADALACPMGTPLASGAIDSQEPVWQAQRHTKRRSNATELCHAPRDGIVDLRQIEDVGILVAIQQSPVWQIRARPVALSQALCLQPLRRVGTPYDLAESSMLLYVNEVLPVLKSCIWVCGGTRDGLSAGGRWIRTFSTAARKSAISEASPQDCGADSLNRSHR
jgi:hypothetical protein